MRLLAIRSIGTSLLQFGLILTLDHDQREQGENNSLGLEKKGSGIFEPSCRF